MTTRLPGPFAELVHAGLLDADALAPLLAILPDEQYVSTAVRNGEGFDSLRWPIACDAALADRLVDLRPDVVRLAETRRELEACGGDAEQLGALGWTLQARYFAAIGGSLEQYHTLRPEPGERERLAFEQAPRDRDETWLALQLVTVHRAAADGLFAYHVYRGLPGPSAEACAWLAGDALRRGDLGVDALVQLAIAVRRASSS